MERDQEDFSCFFSLLIYRRDKKIGDRKEDFPSDILIDISIPYRIRNQRMTAGEEALLDELTKVDEKLW